MKKLIFAAMLLLAIPAFSESPNPPPANGEPEMSKKHHDCGAPIDSGTWILIALAGGYGIYKTLEIRRNHAKSTD